MARPPFQNTSKNIAENSTRKAWERHYGHKRAHQSVPDENLVRMLAHYCRSLPDPEAPLEILDYGCGSGRNGLHFVREGHQVYFYDYAPRAREMVKGELHRINAPGSVVLDTDPFTGDNPLVDLPGPFDIIILWGVLHYNQAGTRDRILNAARQLLKEDGRLLATLRSRSDTHLAGQTGSSPPGQNSPKGQTNDLRGAGYELFDREGARQLFREWSDTRLGYTERRPPGEWERVIAHFLIEATP